MAYVTVFMAPADSVISFYSSKEIQTARRLFKEDLYTETITVQSNLTGKDAAEDIFDLTNNPQRQEERENKWKYGLRSLCVGDVAQVDGVRFLCCNIGWITL